MELTTPVIIVNLKTYKESMGEKAVKLAAMADEVSAETGVCIALAPQFTDLHRITSSSEVPIFAQHIDPVEPGAHTGHIVAENLKDIGIQGTLINHSEHRIEMEDIGKCVEIGRKNNLITVCCAANPEETGEIAKFNPDFIAIEPPELIGSGVSVSNSKPEIVTDSIKIVQSVNSNVKVLCGAGITNGDDVKKALELGAVGVLVASGVVKADDPKEILKDFVKNIKS